MKTVLGLSVTAAGVGWVLVDGTAPVDDDQFAVRDPDQLVPRCLAAVRGAQSIAASSGRRIDAIGVCWSSDVEDRITTLLADLRAVGCSDVRSVRQVTPASADESDNPAADRAERVDPCALLAEMLADFPDADDTESDAEDVAAFIGHDATCGPEAGRTSAYDCAQAVVTNAAPPEPVETVRARRYWTPENWAPENWTPQHWASSVSGARVLSAAAVTAVIALFAVGSQFVGSQDPQPGEAALAGRVSESTAQTTPAPAPAPPVAEPMAAAPEPIAEAAEAPIQLALPQQEPVAPPPAAVEPPVSAVPLAVPQVPETAPVVPVAVPDPALPAVAPLPVDQAAPAAPPEVLPPAPAEPPPPFWLAPPFVPAPPPAAVAPEPVAAPVEHLPAPAPLPGPAVDPVLGALP